MARLGKVERKVSRLGIDLLALAYIGDGMDVDDASEGERTAGIVIKRHAERLCRKAGRIRKDLADLRTVMEGPEDADRDLLDLWRERQTLLTALDADKSDVAKDDPRTARFEELNEKLADTPVKTLGGALTMLTTALREMTTFRYPPEKAEVADVRMIRQAIAFLERKYEAGGGNV
jgi:hypothetical protein